MIDTEYVLEHSRVFPTTVNVYGVIHHRTGFLNRYDAVVRLVFGRRHSVVYLEKSFDTYEEARYYLDEFEAEVTGATE